jgi:hypothetical protein
MVIDPCGCVWRGNPRDGYDLQTCAVHWLADMFEVSGLPPLIRFRRSGRLMTWISVITPLR